MYEVTKQISFLFHIAVIMITAFFVSCGATKNATSKSPVQESYFKQLQATRESFSGGLPNSKKGYDYYIQLCFDRDCTMTFDSLSIDNVSYSTRIVKNKALYFKNQYSKNDTITIRATQHLDNLTRTNNAIPVVKLKYNLDNSKGLVNYYTVTNLQTKAGKPRE